MCGIVGAVSNRNIVPVLIKGLTWLEYRGYDSCGVAALKEDALKETQLHGVRSIKRVADLNEQIQENNLIGKIGIAHTRWATHGAPKVENAHPIFSLGKIAVVHNGIIENHESLREELQQKGFIFKTQTDTEVIAHLIHHFYTHNLLEAVCAALAKLKGAYAIAVMCSDEPDCIIGAREGSPLVVGLGAEENFLASDVLALREDAQQFLFLEEGDVVEIKRNAVNLYERKGDVLGDKVNRTVRHIKSHDQAIELGPYHHYMQKEIFEQPQAILDTLANMNAFSPHLFGENALDIFNKIDSVLILACGTSYYAGLCAKHWLEEIAKIPTQVEIASEYRYRKPLPNPNALIITISQSGETADTLSALKFAKELGQKYTLAICNVDKSALVKNVVLTFLTRAGVEVGVASTKAFTTQLVALFILSGILGKLRGYVDQKTEKNYLDQLNHLPTAIESIFKLEPQIIEWAKIFSYKEHALFLGRGLHYPIALEGALKLKELSYIHAEAYPAGELKHGPLSLVTEAMPVVVIAPKNELLEKLKSNMQEVSARSGQLYVFADDETNIQQADGIHVIKIKGHDEQLSPILHTIPLQLLAYHTACARGTDVDKPRNLAKSVTVE